MSRSHLTRSLFCPRDEGSRGAVAIQVALMLIAIIGFASLGTEIVLLLSTSRHMQSAADAGVLAAVSARTRGSPADYKSEAFALAAAAGFANGVDGTTVAVNSPPLTGNFSAASDAVEVLIAQPRTLALVKVVYSGPFVVRARAVAHTTGFGACALALDAAAGGALSVAHQLGKLQLTLRSLNETAIPIGSGSSEPTWGSEVSRALRLLSGEQLSTNPDQALPLPALSAPVAVDIIRGNKPEQRCFSAKTGQSVDCGGAPASGVPGKAGTPSAAPTAPPA